MKTSNNLQSLRECDPMFVTGFERSLALPTTAFDTQSVLLRPSIQEETTQCVISSLVTIKMMQSLSDITLNSST